MCYHILSIIYRLSIHKGAHQISWMNRYFGNDSINNISLDDERNESSLYYRLFSKECHSKIESLYLKLLSEMKEVSYEESNEIIEALMFLQKVAATALWKYNCNIGEKMEFFVRNFDRLDVAGEKDRLYKKVQEESLRVDPLTGKGPMHVDSNLFTSADSYTVTGAARNKDQFWKLWAEKYPETLSEKNAAEIGKGLAPLVDETWLKHFPEHLTYSGNKLVHHHLDHGNLVYPLPENLHGGNPGRKIFHQHFGGTSK